MPPSSVVSMTAHQGLYGFVDVFFSPGKRHLPTNPSDVLVQVGEGWMGILDELKAPILGKLELDNGSQL